MSLRWSRGLAIRIAAASLAVAACGVGIVFVGVLVVGGDTFARLMIEHGATAEAAHAMFDESIRIVLLVAALTATAAAVLLAALLGSHLATPMVRLGRAAGRIAAGDYRARVPREGPSELASLADSFNRMALSLEEGEQLRRDLIANAAHELRTPLTNLQGYLEGLRDGVIAGDEAIYASLWEEVERLVRLAASLDTLAEGDARSAPARILEVDVAEALRTAIDLAAPSFERSEIAIHLEVPEPLVAEADPDGLAQVLANLLQNAARYTPGGGRVTVHAERRPHHVFVSVENTGDGIPEADLGHVFERFYRVDKSRDQARGGAGIGLAIVQQLVEAAGGSVGAESEGGLTRFWFSLPA